MVEKSYKHVGPSLLSWATLNSKVGSSACGSETSNNKSPTMHVTVVRLDKMNDNMILGRKNCTRHQTVNKANTQHAQTGDMSIAHPHTGKSKHVSMIR
jgi:hypothetical protein